MGAPEDDNDLFHLYAVKVKALFRVTSGKRGHTNSRGSRLSQKSPPLLQLSNLSVSFLSKIFMFSSISCKSLCRIMAAEKIRYFQELS